MPISATAEKTQPLSRPGTLKDLAYQEIHGLLVSGGLARDKIYSAQHFADRLGISRTPAREALLQLASEGFLICLDVRGFKVREFTAKEIHDVFETRQLIETFAARRLVDLLTPADVRLLKDNLRQLAQRAAERDVAGFLEVDKKFHMILVRRLDNQVLAAISENLRSQIAVFGLHALARETRYEEVIREHRAIVAALARKDRKRVVRAIHYHLATTQQQLTEN